MKGYAVNPFITVAAILWGVLPALAKPLFANRKKTGKVERPVKVLQFGEGNFLRAFVDYMIDIANEQGKFNGDIVLVKPIEFGSLDRFHDQECQYTVQLRGMNIRNMQIMQNLTAYVTLFRTQQKQVSFMMIQTD